MLELLPLNEHLGPSPVLLGSVFFIALVFRVVLRFCVLSVYVLCLACIILPVSLNCSFSIPFSVFSNVYLFCVLSTNFCQFICIFHSRWPFLFSLALIYNYNVHWAVLILVLDRYRISAVMKVETYIIHRFTASPIGRAEKRVIMYIETFKTVILFLSVLKVIM